MSITEHLIEQCQFNHWANQQMFNQIPLEMIDTPVVSSFDSLRKTVYHIWDAENIWYERSAGLEITPWPSSAKFSGTFQEAIKQIEILDLKFIELLQSKNLDNIIYYKSWKGESHQNSIREAISHALNHSSYHRGQITTMLRNLGVTQIKSIDIIGYLRSKA